MSLSPAQSSPGAGLAVAIAQSTFEVRYQVEMSRLTFTGLCTYLAVLVDWDYVIEEKALDQFLLWHGRFAEMRAFGSMSYHEWFLMMVDTLDIPQRAPIMTRRLLKQICDENPYSYRLTLEQMGALTGAIHIYESSFQQTVPHQFGEFNLGTWMRVEIPFVYKTSDDSNPPRIGDKVVLELTDFNGQDSIRLVQGARLLGYVREFAVGNARRFVSFSALVYRWDPVQTSQEFSNGTMYGKILLWYDQEIEGTEI